MSYLIQYWEDPPIKREPSDYDGLDRIYIKSITEIETLLINKPKKCTMISLERTGMLHTTNKGIKTSKYKVRILWEKNNPSEQSYKKYTRLIIK